MIDPVTARRTFRRRGVAGAWLVAAVLAVGWAPTADGDIWWHLAAGREMVHRHALLWTDPFSSGALGRPWIDIHWLFQLGAYLIFAAAGLAGLVLAKGLLVAAGALILSRAGRLAPRAGWTPGLFGAALVAALFLSRHLLLVRPVIPTLVFVAIFFHQLELFRRRGGWRALAPLPLLQIAWANVQGLSALGPALVAAYLAGAALGAVVARRIPSLAAGEPGATARWRPLLLVLFGCLLASLVTPYGIEGPRLAVRLLGRLVPAAQNVYSANIVENVPPWSAAFAGTDPFWHLRWFLAVLGASFVVARRRLVPSHIFLTAALVVLAVIANRNVLLLYWLGVPVVVMNLAPAWRDGQAWARRRGPRAARRWLVALPVTVHLALLALAVAAAAREPSIAEPAPWRSPVRSADIIDEKPGPGTIFAADNYGGYLIWRLYPRFRPYIDTRLVLRSADEFAEYLALADNPDSFDGWERPFHFDYVLLPSAYPDRYLGLLAHLAASDQWKLIFTDGTETLFARQTALDPRWDLGDPATTDRIVADLLSRFGNQPRVLAAARLQLAVLESVTGNFAQAERAIAGDASAAADDLRGRCRLALGDLDGAQAIAARRLAADARDVASLDLMAALALRRGDVPGALGYLRRALTVNPRDPDALGLLSELERRPRAP